MTSSSQVPDVSALASIIETMASWQRDGALVQLHPGDLGWAWRHGASAVAASLRVWSEDGTIVAAGFADGPTVLRMTVSPKRWADPGTARRVLADLGLGGGTSFRDGALSVEVPTDTALHSQLVSSGWRAGEAWTPLARDLTEPVDVSRLPLRPEVVDRTRTGAFTSVHRSAWGSRSFTDDLWDTMAGGPAFRNGACILGLDPGGTAVAGVTIWSAGVGRPGLLEPMGVHADHRGRGYGRAICIAAAAELRQRGASTAWVCTPSSLRSAVATYRAAGFTALPERLDLDRPQ